MILFILIAFGLIVYAFHNFKKAFYSFLVFKLFLNLNINLINLPNLPLLTLEFVLCLFFVFYYFFFFRKKISVAENFPLKKGFTFVFVSLFLSTIFASSGFSNNIFNCLQEIITVYLYVYVLWAILRTKEDVLFLVKGYMWAFILIGLYGFYEKYTGSNPIIDFEIASNSSAGKVIDWRYGEENRLGLGRIQSVFIHPIGFGMYLAIISCFYLFLQNKFNRVWTQPLVLKFLFFFLTVSCLFFTNSRGPILYVMIAFWGCISLKNKSTYLVLFFGALLLFFMYDLIGVYFFNIISLFNSSTADAVGGSSVEMRFMQFNAALEIFKESPIVGLGLKPQITNYMLAEALLGWESVWIDLLIKRGIIGCLSYLFLLYSIVKMGEGRSKYFIYFSVLGWLIVSSSTSTPGITISFLMTILLIANRLNLLAKENRLIS